MSMIQTLLRFLSLKSRPEDFPESKVSGDINRTLAILNSLSNGGLRTLWADRAGQLLTRPFAITDAIEVQSGTFNDDSWIDTTGEIRDILMWSGRAVNSTWVSAVLSLGAGETDFYMMPDGLGGYYIDPNYYINFCGVSWGRFKRHKFDAAASLSGFYAAYTLPER